MLVSGVRRQTATAAVLGRMSISGSRRGRSWSARTVPVPVVTREQVPNSQVWSATEELTAFVSENLVAQPISRVSSFLPRALPLYSKDKSNDSLFVPRFYRPPQVAVSEESEPAAVGEGEETSNLACVATLKDQQKEAVAAAVDALKTRGGGVISLPRGAGKTVCGLAVASALGRKTLVVVHRNYLINHWKNAIAQHLPQAKVGLFHGADVRPDASSDIVIASLQTLSGRTFSELSTLAPYGTVVVDECDNVSARVLTQAMFRIPAKFVLGLASNVARVDGLGQMVDHFLGGAAFVGELDGKNEPVEVMIKKFAAPPSSSNDWPSYLTQLTANGARNDAIVDLVKHHAATRQVLVLSEKESHLQDLLKRFTKDAAAAGSPTVAIYAAGMKPVDLQKAEDSDIVLATYQMLSEGLEIPGLGEVILATPRKSISPSLARVLQSAHSLVVDCVDAENGAPDARLDFYRKAGFKLSFA